MNKLLMVLLLAGCAQQTIAPETQMFSVKPEHIQLCKDPANYHMPICYEVRGEYHNYEAYRKQQEAKRDKELTEWKKTQPVQPWRYRYCDWRTGFCM